MLLQRERERRVHKKNGSREEFRQREENPGKPQRNSSPRRRVDGWKPSAVGLLEVGSGERGTVDGSRKREESSEHKAEV